MSRRKLGFYTKKGYSRRKRFCLDNSEELIVKFPISGLLCCIPPDNKVLCSTIKESGRLPDDWNVSLVQSPSTPTPYLALYKLQILPPAHCCASPSFMITVSPNGDWNLSLGSTTVARENCTLLDTCPTKLQSVDSVFEIISSLTSSKYCIGNPDSKFLDILNHNGGIFKDQSGTKTIAYHDKSYFPFPTIRHTRCQLIVSGDAGSRCQDCEFYRDSLHSQASRKLRRESNPSETPSLKTNYRYLSKPEMTDRLHVLQQQKRVTKLKINRLHEKVSKIIDKQSISVDHDMSDDLKQIMTEIENQCGESFLEGSFKKVFWQQQKEAVLKSDKRGVRWHPLFIKWCLYLRHQSSKAYDTLRDSGCIQLPSQRTLRDYSNCVQAKAGFSVEVDRQLFQAAHMTTCQESDKLVCLLLDEMYIREDLVYNKHSGRLIGFCNLGEVNNHLLSFERSVEGDSNPNPPLAKSMMVFMVRGLFTTLRYAYVQFPCCSITGDLLFEPFWHAVKRLERMGFKVLAATFDGASVNRRFVKLHNRSEKLVYKVSNKYAEDRRPLYFFSDPPHLMKTVRNCWASEHRKLWNHDSLISWRHLIELYERDQGKGTGLCMVPKLKFEHVNLTSFSKMRVDLAAQVLSESVSRALLLTGGIEVKETANFASMFDHFFDCLNVSNFTNGTRNRKSFQHPYRHSQDHRLKWLEDKFLAYLESWEASVESRIPETGDKPYTKAQKNRMLLSAETRLGLKMTVKSFVELVRYIFSLPEVTENKLAFLSQNICQDPLENFFGCQRQRGGTSDNPNALEFYQNTQTLRVVNSFCRPAVRGNCRGSSSSDKENALSSSTKLERRRKQKE